MRTAKPLWWWISTWFGAGLAPVASGTVGSLAALPFAYLIQSTLGNMGLLNAAALIFIIGCWSSEQFVKKGGKGDDPKDVVVDEVAGQWLVLAFLPLTWQSYALGFFLFRVFDVLKPWPASWADRKVDGGLGVMLDDVFAAMYGALIGLLSAYYGLLG